MRKDFSPNPWFYPLPVLIIGTYDENGVPDAMNAAWGGLYDADKVILCLSAGHKTTKNIKAKGAFTVAFGTAEQVVECDYVGVESGNKEPRKVEKAGFHVTKSAHVDAPIFDELPVAFECKLLEVTDNGNIIGQIVNISVDDNVLTADGKGVDAAKAGFISFDPCANTYVKLGQVVGKAFSDGAQIQ